MSPTLDRRTFLEATAAAAGTALLTDAAPSRARAAGGSEIRLALVGCGGRGTGAAVQALSTDGPIRLVAMADAFEDRLEESLLAIREHRGDRCDVPPERRFVGFDAYERAMEDTDLVILATPPGFRPLHLAEAVRRGLHVFAEKPVAVDAPGVRAVLAAGEEARAKGLKVGVGLQRRHEAKYRETVARLRGGAIGEPVLLRAYWADAGVWMVPRRPEWSEMTYQMRNWYYFNWLCGDHVVEQHIHNLDVCNWIAGGPPESAQGQGGRLVRTGPEYGQIFDHHSVELTYPGGAKCLSQARHMKGCWWSVSEHAHGTRGTADVSGGRIDGPGGWSWRFEGEPEDPYQLELDRLVAAIRADAPHDEVEVGATATMTAILARMASYSGREVGWDEALASDLSLAPARCAFDADPPVLPGPDGRYPVPIPGVTRAL